MIIKINNENIKKILRRKFARPALIAASALSLTGCSPDLGYNKSVGDTNYGFDKCLITGDDTAIILDVASWADYDGEQLQLITDDNMVVLTSSFDTNAFTGINDSITIENVAKNSVTDAGEVHDLSTSNETSLFNKTLFDDKWSFNKAVLFNGNNSLILDVKKWRDYEGEQLKVETDDGLILNLCSYNSKLINDVNSETKASDFARYYVGEDGTVNDLSKPGYKGFNYELYDFNNMFNKAIIMHNGSSIILPIEAWGDYEGEQLQIQVVDGPVLLTDSYHTILVNDTSSTLKASDIATYLSKNGAVQDYSAGYNTDNAYYNKTIVDLNNGFKSGILSDGNFVSVVNLKNWLDYEGEQLQIELDSGDLLLTSSMMLNMANGGNSNLNTSTIAAKYGTEKIIDYNNNNSDKVAYNKAFYDKGIKFKYALKVVDGNVTVIPLEYWRDFDNTDGKKKNKKSPFKESPYSYQNPYEDIMKTLNSLNEDDEEEKEASPNCEQLELFLPDGSTIVTTAYDTILVNNKSDILELAELFRGENGVITDLTQYVGEPSNSGWNYYPFDKYKFTYAIFTNGNKSQVMPINSWLDFKEGEQLQIKFDSSSGILTSYVNTTLVATKTEGLECVIASAFQGTLNKGEEAKAYILK